MTASASLTLIFLVSTTSGTSHLVGSVMAGDRAAIAMTSATNILSSNNFDRQSLTPGHLPGGSTGVAAFGCDVYVSVPVWYN